jgi:hypothetical protein
VQGQGEQTMKDFGKINKKNIKGSAYEMKLLDFRNKWQERNGKLEGTTAAKKEKYLKAEKEFMDKLDDVLQNANTPLERIAVSLSPVLSSISGVLNAIGSVFMGPVNGAMKVLDTVFAKLQINLDNLASNLRAGDFTPAEALGRLFGEIMKAIATLFDPTGLGKETGSAIDKMFADFKKGFDSINGEKYTKMVVDGLQSLIMRLLFKEGNITQGLTPLGEGLGKIFLALSAPAFVNALIMGLIPLAVQGMGGMLWGTLTKLGPKVAAANASKNAAKLAAAKTASLGMNAAYLGGGTATAAATTGGGAAGLAAVPVWGWVAALAASVVIFEKPIMALTNTMQKIGQGMQKSSNWLTSSFGHVVQGIGELFGGITKFFNGLWEIVSGLITGDADRVINGIKKLFNGIVDVLVGIVRTIGGMGGMVIGAVENLLKTLEKVILRAANKIDFLNVIPDKPEAQKPAANALSAFFAPGSAFRPLNPKAKAAGQAKGSSNPFMGNLGQAVNYEMKNKPSGSHLVVANSSETIIPAAGGLNGGMEGIINAIWQSSVRVASTTQKGFEVLTKTTMTGNAAVTSSVSRSIAVQNANTNRLMSAIQASAAARGMAGGAGMALGAGYGGAGGKISGELGRYIKSTGGAPGSIWEHPEHGGVKGKHSANSYHYSGRAIDIGAHAYEQGGVIARIQQFNKKYGVKPVEFLHAGNDKNHQDHVHVAYALGAGNPAFFSSQGSATAWEKRMMPGGAKVRSITSNSSESLGGATVGNINVTVNAGHTNDPDKLATMVAERLSRAIQEVRSASVLV